METQSDGAPIEKANVTAFEVHHQTPAPAWGTGTKSAREQSPVCGSMLM